MVGSGSWGFPDREGGDTSRRESIVFAKWPVRTNRGLRWLVNVKRVSVIEYRAGSWFWSDFLGFGSTPTEVITYEVIDERN